MSDATPRPSSSWIPRPSEQRVSIPIPLYLTVDIFRIDFKMSSFKIVKIKQRTLALFMIIGFRVILLCLKTKRQYRHFFSKNSDIYKKWICGLPKYLGHGFILVKNKYFGMRVRRYHSYKLYHMASVSRFKKVPFPIVNQHLYPLQIYKKLSLLFFKNSCL